MNETAQKFSADNWQTRAGSNGRGLASIMTEIKDELKDFVDTRVRMVKAELQESVGALKVGLPLALLALVLFGIASLLFTSAAVVLVASAFAGNPYAWFFAFVIIGVTWLIFGGIFAFFAVNQFKSKFPKRTVKVLKADKAWLQAEARSHS